MTSPQCPPFLGTVFLAASTKNTAHAHYGIFLVSDGGVTLSSINEPSININNPDAPIYQGATDVPVTFSFGGLALLWLGLRRKQK